MLLISLLWHFYWWDPRIHAYFSLLAWLQNVLQSFGKQMYGFPHRLFYFDMPHLHSWCFMPRDQKTCREGPPMKCRMCTCVTKVTHKISNRINGCSVVVAKWSLKELDSYHAGGRGVTCAKLCIWTGWPDGCFCGIVTRIQILSA